MGCNCKKNRQAAPPAEPEKVDLAQVTTHPVELTQTPTDLTEEQKDQVTKIIQKIEDITGN